MTRGERRERATRPVGAAERLEEKRARQRRARDEGLDVREKFDRPYRSFEVRNPSHATRYRVAAPGRDPVLLCPCPDFGRRGLGTCKHVEAVRPYLEIAASGPPPGRPRPPPGGPIWAELEAGLSALPTDPWSSLAPAWRIGDRLTRRSTAGRPS